MAAARQRTPRQIATAGPASRWCRGRAAGATVKPLEILGEGGRRWRPEETKDAPGCR